MKQITKLFYFLRPEKVGILGKCLLQVALVICFFLSAVLLISDQRKYIKIRNSRIFPRLFAIFDSSKLY
jgi:hypothetical protein